MPSRAARLPDRIRNAARKAVTRALELEIRTRTLPGEVVVGRRVEGLAGVTSAGHNFYGDATWFTGPVTVGLATTINRHARLEGPLSIGNYCQLAARCAVLAADHPTSHATIYTGRSLLGGDLDRLSRTEPVTVGHGVWVGYGAVLLKGVTVGNGAIVGAGAVVTHSIPAYGIAVGNPARLVRSRLSDEVIEIVERSRWWTLRPDRLEPFRSFFTADLASVSEAELRALGEVADRVRAVADSDA